MKKFKFFIIALLLLIIYSNRDVSAQEWKQIVPLISTCEDVKRILSINDCKFPTLRQKFPKYNITLDFSTDEDEWNVSKETVVSVLVILKELIRLEDYEANLAEYKIIPEDDLPSQKIYRNDKKGIELTVSNDKWIRNIYFYPSQKNKEKPKCK